MKKNLIISRKQLIKQAKRIVVKVGSSILCDAKGHFSKTRAQIICSELSYLLKQNKKVVLVSSGSVACGMDMLHLKKRPSELPMLQACAAIGQGKLMKVYEDYFVKRKLHTAQMLLTQDILHDRMRYLNTRNTLLSLIKLRALPIVNENDTVATDEIKFGDNDRLSAMVALIMGADLVINLSNVEGVLGSNQRVIGSVSSSSELSKLTHHLFDEVNQKTVGGMKSKLEAARVLMQSGTPMIIADGKNGKILEQIINGEDVGTLFMPSDKKTSVTRSWLIHSASTKGLIQVDRGAYDALKNHGKSLLPSGIVSSRGNYKAGDAVQISYGAKNIFARGLTHFSSEEVKQIKKRKTSEIKDILGYKFYDEVVHRDNLVLI